MYVIYVINPFHLAFGQPVSHCLTIGELIPARGVLLREIKITVIGQIINLCMSSHRMQFWEWTKDYIMLDTSSQNEMLTHGQYVMEIPCSKQAIGEEPCGFCGLDGCLTQLQEKKKGSLSVASNCLYHYAAMNYKAAAKFSKAVPCTNICPSALSTVPHLCLWATTNHMEI